MRRFTNLLCQGLTARGVNATVLRPATIIGRHSDNSQAFAKWAGYTDKLLLFPHQLRRSVGVQSTGQVIVHICDHSNSVYVPWIKHVPHVVTCHDLLAVRAARAEFDGIRTRWSGRQLQHAIVHGLQRASRIVCDSQATRSDFVRVTGAHGETSTIYPAVSPCFAAISPAEAAHRATSVLPRARTVGGQTTESIVAGRYILHVGGNQWYKNRPGLIAIYAALVKADVKVPPLLLVGKPISLELRHEILKRQLGGRVFELADVADTDLAVLYASARVLLFPSLAEGFGWPVLEAMACGCRVVASNRAPLTEVASDAADYVEPEEFVDAARRVLAVLAESEDMRAAKVRAGLTRASRFSLDSMAGAYLSVYTGLLASS